MPLLSLVASSPEAVRRLTIEQVVATAGDSRLRDRTESQRKLREYLRQVTIDALATCVDYCFSNAFPKCLWAATHRQRSASKRFPPTGESVC
jgi:hypothetical protein